MMADEAEEYYDAQDLQERPYNPQHNRYGAVLQRIRRSRWNYFFLFLVVALLGYAKMQVEPVDDESGKRQPAILEEVCLHVLGSLGCSPKLVKQFDQGLNFFITIFKKKPAHGTDFISFDFSSQLASELRRFGNEYHLELANVKEDVFYHSGFTTTKPWWNVLSPSEGGLQSWISSAGFPALVAKKVQEAHAAFQHLDDAEAKSIGYWSHWNESTLIAEGTHLTGTHHATGMVNLQMNKRGTVDVFLVYHESAVTVQREVPSNSWFWQTKTMEKVKVSGRIRDLCQWYVRYKMLNASTLAYPKLVRVNMSAH
eukprot:TRINITY_DN14877_c0_g1_i1.p1 TRINITY_DN14877_c0_g1~~TRINITY_DN14877_c0_g1_i1.p1  ORF type:complete len:312 (+),score=35.97 TRINITY_DN14877_c0_g1_i1:80-1015(+)